MERSKKRFCSKVKSDSNFGRLMKSVIQKFNQVFSFQRIANEMAGGVQRVWYIRNVDDGL